MALDNRTAHMNTFNQHHDLHDVEQLQYVLKQLICAKTSQYILPETQKQIVH